MRNLRNWARQLKVWRVSEAIAIEPDENVQASLLINCADVHELLLKRFVCRDVNGFEV